MKYKTLTCGFRRDFRLWFDREYYDGNWYALNLGWFWICYYR